MRPTADFRCPICNRDHVAATYAIRREDDAKICSSCAHAQELQTAESDPVWYGYLSSDLRHVTGWTGNVLATVTRTSSSWNGSKIVFFRAVTPSGRRVYGRGAGAGICCTVRAAKVRA